MIIQLKEIVMYLLLIAYQTDNDNCSWLLLSVYSSRMIEYNIYN